MVFLELVHEYETKVFILGTKIMSVVDKRIVSMHWWCQRQMNATAISNGILLPKLFWPTVRKKCARDREKLLKCEVEGREFAKILRLVEQFIRTVKGRKFLWNRMLFKISSWKFLRSNTLEQLWFKFEKIIGI